MCFLPAPLKNPGLNFAGHNMTLNSIVKNLYRYVLQRETDVDGDHEYNNYSSDDLMNLLLRSEEYKNLVENSGPTSNRPLINIPYTIIKVNDRAANNCRTINKVLEEYQYHCNITFIADDAEQFLLDRGIDINWDNRKYDRSYLPGELGITASVVVACEYIIKNNLEEMLILEDDAVITGDFVGRLSNCYADLPNDYDYLVSGTVFPAKRITDKLDAEILINSEYICQADLQDADLRMVLYSNQGAKKILDALKQRGFVAPIDEFIFDLTREKYLKGYTTFFHHSLVINTEICNSLIDHNRIRK